MIVDSLQLQPTDLLVVAKLAVSENPSASVRDLAAELPGVSKSAVGKSLQRLRALDLVKDDGTGQRRVNRLALRDLFGHAIRWLAPARPGRFELGLATAHTAEVIASKLAGDGDPVVIPLPEGAVRGRAVAPIHPSAPVAAARDPKLHRLLAIVDSLRIGGACEREVARGELAACL